MARYAICEKCKKFIEYKPVKEYKAGMTFTKLVCPECGHVKESNTNHVHYGNDARQ